MKFLALVSISLCMAQSGIAQSKSSNHHLGIGAYYINPKIIAIGCQSSLDEKIPLAAEFFCSYQLHKRWSLETGLDIRKQVKITTLSFTTDYTDTSTFNYKNLQMSVPLRVNFNLVCKGKFNLGLVTGLKGTLSVNNWYVNSTSPGESYHATYNDLSIALTGGFEESVRICPRMKFNAQEIFNNYFGCGNTNSIDLKLGLEYFFR
ncbi:MAG TPA: hypothetical protein VE978_04705 [Chitinophagales bacterium]|nr:hypothetical protein [Chitinophagales bacterium]